DEAIRLYGGRQVLSGDFPYRDFYTIYGPAVFYWTVALFKIFGTQILTFRFGQIFASTAGVGYGLFALYDLRDTWLNLISYPAVAILYHSTPYPVQEIRQEILAISWTFSGWTLMALFRVIV